MTAPLAHPTVSAVKATHAAVLAAHGGRTGLRDEALLESAVAAPKATMMGQPLIPDAIEVAAAYLFYLCQNHPFVGWQQTNGVGKLATVCAEHLSKGRGVRVVGRLKQERWDDADDIRAPRC